MSTLVITGNSVRNLLRMSEVIGAVEQAFRDLGDGKAKMPAKSYLVLDKGDFRAMPAAVPEAAGMKWVNVHPQNPARGLPTVMAVIIYSDPDTGYPLAVMDGTLITAFRTGATAAIAAKYLARRDSHTLGIIGAGRQAYTQITAHAELFDLKLIKVYDLSQTAVENLINHFPGYTIKSSSAAEATASDILCTVTPARAPVVKKEWVRSGTHINAIGADAAGKEELEPDVLNGATVVVDDIRQASASGEINVPIARGLFSTKQVQATLSDIIAGKKPGRTSERDITIFDSTGIAIEDVAVAKLVYQKARAEGAYTSIDIVEG